MTPNPSEQTVLTKRHRASQNAAKNPYIVEMTFSPGYEVSQLSLKLNISHFHTLSFRREPTQTGEVAPCPSQRSQVARAASWDPRAAKTMQFEESSCAVFNEVETNKKLVVTSATLVVTGALLVVTRS